MVQWFDVPGSRPKSVDISRYIRFNHFKEVIIDFLSILLTFKVVRYICTPIHVEFNIDSLS